jgi:hypothetical protein
MFFCCCCFLIYRWKEKYNITHFVCWSVARIGSFHSSFVHHCLTSSRLRRAESIRPKLSTANAHVNAQLKAKDKNKQIARSQSKELWCVNSVESVEVQVSYFEFLTWFWQICNVLWIQWWFVYFMNNISHSHNFCF